jgi:hypothetical protein
MGDGITMNLSVEDTKRAWNPRFVVYAISQGRMPEQQLEHDTKEFPGGKMCGFILWMNSQWRAYFELRGWKRTGADEHILSQEDHAEFDKWLSLRVRYRAVMTDTYPPVSA